MSYIRAEFDAAYMEYLNRSLKDPTLDDPRNAFKQGLEKGFKIALLGYGVWKGGTQVIGGLDERVQDIITRELKND